MAAERVMVQNFLLKFMMFKLLFVSIYSCCHIFAPKWRELSPARWAPGCCPPGPWSCQAAPGGATPPAVCPTLSMWRLPGAAQDAAHLFHQLLRTGDAQGVQQGFRPGEGLSIELEHRPQEHTHRRPMGDAAVHGQGIGDGVAGRGLGIAESQPRQHAATGMASWASMVPASRPSMCPIIVRMASSANPRDTALVPFAQ